MPISWIQEDDEENDRWNRVTIHKMNCSLYNEINLAASCLIKRPHHFHIQQRNSTEQVIQKDDPRWMMGSVFKEFSESYNQANENWGEPASEEVTNVVSVAFKEILPKTTLKNLLID